MTSSDGLPVDTWPALYAAGATLREISASTGFTKQHVRQELLARGVVMRPQNRRGMRNRQSVWHKAAVRQNQAGCAHRIAASGGESAFPVTANPDDIGPDGTVRLRCYLPMANSLWFFAGCQDRQGCGHVAPIGIQAAIQTMGSGEATLGQIEQRLRCSRCGSRQVGIVVQPDTRTAEAIERGGPAPETRAGLGTIPLTYGNRRPDFAGGPLEWRSPADRLPA